MLWFQARAWGWLGGIRATWVLPDHNQGSGRVISRGGAGWGGPRGITCLSLSSRGEASGAGMVTAALRDTAAGPPRPGPSAASRVALPAAPGASCLQPCASPPSDGTDASIGAAPSLHQA